MKLKELIKPSIFDKKAVELVLQYMYKNKNYGKQTSARPEKVTIKDTKTGKIYGRKTIHQT